jgi:putative aldouronate transport system substrate-binding protein
MYINTAWLKDAGLSMPKTTREYENMLRAFKNRKPNSDGRKTYPFIDIRTNVIQPRFIAPLVGSFVYIGGGNRWFYKEPNGSISPVFTTEKWREALTWIRSMVDEGLIDPLSFTQDAEQIKSIGSATSEYAYGASTYYPLNFIPLDDPRSETWALMGPLAGASGEPVATYSQTMPSNMYSITKTCKYPESAFRLGDLLMSERYSVMGRFGEEGVDWKRPALTDKTYYEGYPPYLIPIAVWGTPTSKHWEQAEPRILPYRIMNGFMVQGQLHHLDLWNAQASSQGVPYFKPENSIGTTVYTPEEYERIAEIRANVETYFLECYTRFLLRDMSLENDWNRYLADLKNMGLDTYVEVNRTAYARMNK